MKRRRARTIATALLCSIAAAVLSLTVGMALAQSPAPSVPAPSSSPAPSSAPSGGIPTTAVPFFADWASSPHAERAAQAFTHWNSDGTIPPQCAKCHSAPGFIDFLGADGTAAGVVDHPAPVGTVITCIACHNDKSVDLTAVTFPSGLNVAASHGDAICMTCHQGLGSTEAVTKALAGMGEDAANPKLEFIDAHYAAAGAILMGTQARVAYQYPGKTYAGRLVHAAPYTGCTSCHQLHTVAVKVEACAGCHKEVTDKASLHLIRVSKTDYDGTGDANEGMADEIGHMSDRLYAAIRAYATSVAGKPIVFSAEVYPYFFIDTNGNGIADKDELRFPNRYKSWTPRLMEAAYNYLFVLKDPGAFAHNPAYTLQILYDSIADLGTKVPVDLSKAKRP